MRNRILLAALLMTLAAAAAQAQSPWQPLPDKAPEPPDNPTTAAKVELGKMLYFDPRLSSTGTVSCFSCHNVMEGGDDHMTTSAGVHGLKGGRNAPTVWNAAFHSVQFWDGRAPSLEEQSKGPPVNPIEMGMRDLDAVIDRIRHIPGYRPYFEQAFGPGDVVTMDNAAKAIAAYERTLITPGSAYDRYAKGDKTALTPQQVRGMETFAERGLHQLSPGARVQRSVAAGRHRVLHEVPDLPREPVRREIQACRRPGPVQRDEGRSRSRDVAGTDAAQPDLHGAVHAHRHREDAAGGRARDGVDPAEPDARRCTGGRRRRLPRVADREVPAADHAATAADTG